MAEFALAVAWLADGVVDPLPLLSAEFASGQLAQALEFAGDKRRAAKVQWCFRVKSDGRRRRSLSIV